MDNEKVQKEHVLVLGTTGVEKEKAINQLRAYDTAHSNVNFQSVDFEKTYLHDVLEENGSVLYSYLLEKNLRQRELWLKAWKRFKPYIKKNRHQHILLCLHGVITSELTGTRSPIDIPCLEEFSPTKIITLIDDVYLKWHRTKERAAGASYRGEPTLEQLLDARRTEVFIGDLIAGHMKHRPKHYVIATQHPARTLHRLLFGGKDVVPIYLSFPIAGPRNMSRAGDSGGIWEVNRFLEAANVFEKDNPKMVCFCPLTIDEYPLINTLDKYDKEHPNISREEEEQNKLEFSLNERWSIKSFWGNEPLLCETEKHPLTIGIPIKQVRDAVGLIKSDVRLRDYRLVRQAKRLAVFNPWFNGKETEGVRNEISMAGKNFIPVHIYQDPIHDSSGDAKRGILKSDAGAMGRDPNSFGIAFHENLNEVFRQTLI